MTSKVKSETGVQGSAHKRVPVINDAEVAEFITGFPCTRFQCRGELTAKGLSGERAITCSRCDHVYYRLNSS